jgi:hypothetical protein
VTNEDLRLVAWFRSRASRGAPLSGARDKDRSDAHIHELVEWYRTFGPIALDEFDRRRGVE